MPPSAGKPGAAARTTSTHETTRSAACDKTAAAAQRLPGGGGAPVAVEFRGGTGAEEIRATAVAPAPVRGCSPRRGDHGGHRGGNRPRPARAGPGRTGAGVALRPAG
ncbi:hypothetical protein GCM10027174_28660 [Salinifilum aidingensis]